MGIVIFCLLASPLDEQVVSVLFSFVNLFQKHTAPFPGKLVFITFRVTPKCLEPLLPTATCYNFPQNQIIWYTTLYQCTEKFDIGLKVCTLRSLSRSAKSKKNEIMYSPPLAGIVSRRIRSSSEQAERIPRSDCAFCSRLSATLSRVQAPGRAFLSLSSARRQGGAATQCPSLYEHTLEWTK
jgi:hypothetical protein